MRNSESAPQLRDPACAEKFEIRNAEIGNVRLVTPRTQRSGRGGLRDLGIKPRQEYGARGVQEEGWKVQGGRWKRELS